MYSRHRPPAILAALIAVFLALLPGVAGSAAAPIIVYPPDRALLSGDGSLNILGFKSGDTPVSLMITGKSGWRSLPIGTGAFTVKVKLDPGENSLVLQDRTITVFLAGREPSTIPPGFSPADTHAVDNGCEDCHNFSGGAATLLEKPPALCARCHDDVLKGKDGKPQAVLHAPAAEGNCIACHDIHQLSIKQLTAAAKREVCFGCHDDFTAGGNVWIHSPIAQGECSICHAPHGSSATKLLKADRVRDLCLTCHKDPALSPEGVAWAVPHPALDDGCLTCHRPHVAAVPRLLSRPQGELCTECHEDKNRSSEGRKWLTPHPPVVAGLCSSCHGPHGGREKGLLLRPVLENCMVCHPEIHPKHLSVELDQSTLQPINAIVTLPPGFPVRKSDGRLSCEGCHRPHGSDFPHLWSQDEASFCVRCHPNL